MSSLLLTMSYPTALAGLRLLGKKCSHQQRAAPNVSALDTRILNGSLVIPRATRRFYWAGRPKRRSQAFLLHPQKPE